MLRQPGVRNVILTYVVAVSFLDEVHLVFSVFIADMAEHKEYKTTRQSVLHDFKI